MMRAAALQVTSELDPEQNIERVMNWLATLSAKQHCLDLVVLPEMFTFRALGRRPIDEVVLPVDGKVAELLSGAADRLRSNLVAGTFLAKDASGEVRNTSLVFDRSGGLVSKYSKTHLYDSPEEQESQFVKPGNSIRVIDLDVCRVGIVVCYELRFPPELHTL